MIEEVVKKREVILNPQRRHLAQHARQFWVIDAEEGTLISDVLNPQYWAHCAQEMSRFDHITVQLETGEWMLQLLVVDKGRNWVKVHKLEEYLLMTGEPEATPEDAFEAKWGGPHHKWRVIRKSDKEPLSSGHVDQEAARAWIRNYESTITKT